MEEEKNDVYRTEVRLRKIKEQRDIDEKENLRLRLLANPKLGLDVKKSSAHNSDKFTTDFQGKMVRIEKPKIRGHGTTIVNH